MNIKDLHKDILAYYKEFKQTIVSAHDVDSFIVMSVKNKAFGDWHAIDTWTKYGKDGYLLKGRVTVVPGKVS